MTPNEVDAIVIATVVWWAFVLAGIGISYYIWRKRS